jgi:protein SCO1/2
MMPPRNSRITQHLLWAAILALFAFGFVSAQVPEDSTPPALRGVGLDQHLGEAVPRDLTFLDEAGRSVRLGDYFDKRPLILTLNYYQCPMLCTLELNGLVASLKTMSLEPERDFRIVTVSINPKEGPALAAEKKAVYVKDYARAGAASGWHFLTGEEPSIQVLARRVGFRYSFDAASGQYAHAAGIVVLTPSGRISRYFYGIDYAPRDLRLALVESSEGKIGSLADKVLLFCFHYDPATGRYSIAALRTMRLGGLLTALVLGVMILRMLRRERARRATESVEPSPRAL